MTGAVFVDTNVLVYGRDASEPEKQQRAMAWMTHLWESQRGRLSVQVLQEFYVSVTRKLPRPLPPGRAREIIREYLAWTVVPGTPDLLDAALDLHQRSGLSFWDAMIIQAAMDAGCERVYSEDMGDGRRYGPVTVVNPFARTTP